MPTFVLARGMEHKSTPLGQIHLLLFPCHTLHTLLEFKILNVFSFEKKIIFISWSHFPPLIYLLLELHITDISYKNAYIHTNGHVALRCIPFLFCMSFFTEDHFLFICQWYFDVRGYRCHQRKP